MVFSADRIVWRLSAPEFAPGLDGEGARKYGGRWNSPGLAMVYCAGSLALAALECFVHLPPAMRRPGKLPPYVAVKLLIPPDLAMESIAPEPLPGTPLQGFQALGDAWLRAGATAVLCVPSRVIPVEHNVLINPAHPDAARVQVVAQERFAFDPRMGAV